MSPSLSCIKPIFIAQNKCWNSTTPSEQSIIFFLCCDHLHPVKDIRITSCIGGPYNICINLHLPPHKVQFTNTSNAMFIHCTGSFFLLHSLHRMFYIHIMNLHRNINYKDFYLNSDMDVYTCPFRMSWICRYTCISIQSEFLREILTFIMYCTYKVSQEHSTQWRCSDIGNFHVNMRRWTWTCEAFILKYFSASDKFSYTSPHLGTWWFLFVLLCMLTRRYDKRTFTPEAVKKRVKDMKYIPK